MTTVTLAGSQAGERRTRCRYLVEHNDPCSGEAVDPVGEILLCARHLGLALELVNRRTALILPRKRQSPGGAA